MLGPDFKEFVALLDAREVRYLIVGGYAVAFHGYPRYTGDLDVWIERSPANATRLVAVLEDFGFGGLGLDAETFTAPETVVQLGHPPFRIDILTDLEGVEFAACYPERETVELDGVSVAFIGLEALRENKRALGRPQDLADLDHLRE